MPSPAVKGLARLSHRPASKPVDPALAWRGPTYGLFGSSPPFCSGVAVASLLTPLLIVGNDSSQQINTGDEIPTEGEVIDLRRHTCIPGLIDADTHYQYSWDGARGTTLVVRRHVTLRSRFSCRHQNLDEPRRPLDGQHLHRAAVAQPRSTRTSIPKAMPNGCRATRGTCRYNNCHPHQALSHRTPMAVRRKGAVRAGCGHDGQRKSVVGCPRPQQRQTDLLAA